MTCIKYSSRLVNSDADVILTCLLVFFAVPSESPMYASSLLLSLGEFSLLVCSIYPPPFLSFYPSLFCSIVYRTSSLHRADRLRASTCYYSSFSKTNLGWWPTWASDQHEYLTLICSEVLSISLSLSLQSNMETLQLIRACDWPSGGGTQVCFGTGPHSLEIL